MTGVLHNTEAKVLALLCSAAERGEPCPALKVIAQSLGNRSVGAASRALRTLTKLEYIAVERKGKLRTGKIPQSIVVTILATGERTAVPPAPTLKANQPKPRSRPAAKAPSKTPAKPKVAYPRRWIVGAGLRFKTCQWIDGEATADDGCKCGELTSFGGPWCPAHHARIWKRAETPVGRAA